MFDEPNVGCEINERTHVSVVSDYFLIYFNINETPSVLEKVWTVRLNGD